MTADFLIVGAGSAGCVLADRLSASGRHRVVVLEAGGEADRQEVHIPVAFSQLFRSEVDWSYETTPQAALGGRCLFWPRGKMLGGSSSLNAMIYQHGHRAVYDRWAAAGNPGWSYDELLPHFASLETHHAGGIHGGEGGLQVQAQRSLHPMSQAFVDAALQLGYPLNTDFAGGTLEGFGPFDVTQDRGARCSAADAFLTPARARANVEVRTHAHATRVLWEGRRAVGVEARIGDALEPIFAREILLCGGAIGSPKLLQLSGVGPAELLGAHGIDVVVNLPAVGAHLQDHPVVSVCYTADAPSSLKDVLRPETLAAYTTARRGLMTSNIAEAGGFVRLDESAPIPDLQFHFAPGYFLRHGFERPRGHGFTIGPTLVRVHSYGTVRIASSDPFVPPDIDPAYLSDERDLERLVRGVKLARRLAETPALSRFRQDEYLPGSAVQSDAEVAHFVRDNLETLYHPAGTCRMGSGDDAVVDAELRVHGTEGLRVVDCSVMPELVNANTNAPTMAIASRAAAFLTQ